MTGQLEEEKMQVYVRFGIRLLYKVCFFLSFQFSGVVSDLLRCRALRVVWKEGVVSHLLQYCGKANMYE
jgi:hypothetical protein